MWKYSKKLQYPINIRNKNLKMAKAVISQYGGAQGELGAALRYLNQRYTMPDATIVDANITFLSIFNLFITWYIYGTNTSSIIQSLTTQAKIPNTIMVIITNNLSFPSKIEAVRSTNFLYTSNLFNTA